MGGTKKKTKTDSDRETPAREALKHQAPPQRNKLDSDTLGLSDAGLWKAGWPQTKTLRERDGADEALWLH